MSDEFVITSDLLENPKFLACSMLAGRLYMAMILSADHEGRALADPLTWTSKAACWGPAAATRDEVQSALDELDSVELAPRYKVGGKSYLFLPGRFEHNAGRTYWRRSKCPLPPMSLLVKFPEYLNAIKRLTTKAEIRNTLRDKENWRYPEVSQCSPESSGNMEGNDRSTPVGVGVDVEVGTPNGVCEEGHTPVDQSLPRSQEASPAQIGYARSALRKMKPPQTLEAWMADHGVKVLLSEHLDQILDEQSRDGPVDESAKASKREALMREVSVILAESGQEEAERWASAQGEFKAVLMKHIEFAMI